ncbi:MAG: hypothetical protein V9E94_02625 [Microthrixaceae bacterium]
MSDDPQISPDVARERWFDQPYTYDVTDTADELATRFEMLEPGVETDHVAAVAGRLMLRRVQGKLAFGTLADSERPDPAVRPVGVDTRLRAVL